MRRLFLVFLIGIATPFIVLGVCGTLGYLPVRATSSPSKIESMIATRSVDARIAREAKGLKNPLKPTDATLLAGMKLYRNDCAGCHGLSGKPSDWGTKNFYPPVPQFADELPDMKDSEMFLIVKHGIRYTGMGGWDGMMKDEEIWSVVTFLSRLGSLPPAVARIWTGGSRG